MQSNRGDSRGDRQGNRRRLSTLRGQDIQTEARFTPGGTPSSLLVSRDYEDKPSAPAWGVNLSAKNLPELEQFRFDEQVAQLIPEA